MSYIKQQNYLLIAGGILGPHVETALGRLHGSSVLVRIHGLIHPAIKKIIKLTICKTVRIRKQKTLLKIDLVRNSYF